MLFEVDHVTRFSYSEPAALGPHTVRLRPRSDAAQVVRAWHLDVDPAPAGRFDFTDRYGNLATRLWWVGETDALSLRTAVAVETLRANPFDYLVFDPAARRVPARYPDGETDALHAYLAPPPPATAAFAREVAAEAGGEVSPFLVALAVRIRACVEHEVRDDGDPLPSDVTLAAGRGACRDQTMVFVDACRALGIAGRFVSGYQEGAGDGVQDDPSGERHLHAWAEAYVPEAGWRGFDPSQGLAVADRHVAVAAAAVPRDAAPTEGSFGPAGVRARLEARIEIRILPAG